MSRYVMLAGPMFAGPMFAGLCTLALSACAPPMTFQGPMSGALEVPATTSAGTGTATATLFPTTNALTYTVRYTGLTGAATGAHFHGPAAFGANAPVVVPIGTNANPVSGGVTLTDAQAADLIAGRWYVNVHTAQNPGGEILAQMQRTQ